MMCCRPTGTSAVQVPEPGDDRLVGVAADRWLRADAMIGTLVQEMGDTPLAGEFPLGHTSPGNAAL